MDGSYVKARRCALGEKGRRKIRQLAIETRTNNEDPPRRYDWPADMSADNVSDIKMADALLVEMKAGDGLGIPVRSERPVSRRAAPLGSTNALSTSRRRRPAPRDDDMLQHRIFRRHLRREADQIEAVSPFYRAALRPGARTVYLVSFYYININTDSG